MTDLSTAPEAPTPGWPNDTSNPAPTSDRAVDASPVFALDEPAQTVLVRLESAGWRTLDARVTSGQGFVDHVAIGGGGIFVIDTHSFAITDQGPAMPSKEVLASVEQVAAAVRSLLPPLTRQYVVPVVAFIDKGAMSIARGSVQVCTTSMLAQLIESRPTVLSATELDEILHNLDAHLASDPSARPTASAATGTTSPTVATEAPSRSRADRKADKAADKGERRGIRFRGRRGSASAAAAEDTNSEQERIEQHRLQAQQRELERIEAERREAERLEQARLEADRVAAERLEAERLEADRARVDRIETERLEAEREARTLAEAERVEAERAEAERQEAERLEAARLEAERREAELAEAARIDAEREAAALAEAERLEAQRIEFERQEAERAEVERLEEERLEAARVDAEREAAGLSESERADGHVAEAEQAEAEQAEEVRLEAERRDAERVIAEREAAERAEAHATEAAATAPVGSEDDELVRFMRGLRRSDRLHRVERADPPGWEELSLADVSTERASADAGTDVTSAPAEDAEPTTDATAPRQPGGRRKAPTKSWSARIKPGRGSSTPGRRMATTTSGGPLTTEIEAVEETSVDVPIEPTPEPDHEVVVETPISSPARVDLNALYREQAPHSTEDRRELTRAERLADPDRSAALSTVASRWKQSRVAPEPARPTPQRETVVVAAAPAPSRGKQGAPIPGAPAEAPTNLSRRGRQMYAVMSEQPRATDEPVAQPKRSMRSVVRKTTAVAAVAAVFALGALNFDTIKVWVEDHARSNPSPATLNDNGGNGKADNGKGHTSGQNGNGKQSQ